MTSASAGVAMALAAILCVQAGVAVSVSFLDEVGSQGAACLRLAFAGLILLAAVRPRAAAFSRRGVTAAVALGAAPAAASMFLMAAVARIRLGTAAALQFVGSLGLAMLRGRGNNTVWPLAATVGVVLLTEP